MSPDPPEFDPASDPQVGLWDEMPLWSAMAGLLLLEHVPLDARRVLDVGCGTGFPTLELAERLGPGARVTGIDPWAAAIRRAGAKRAAWPVANAGLVRGDAAAMPFPDAAFDLVVSNLGVNNFADPAATVSECRRVLGRGGHLALTTNLSGHFAELYDAYESVLADDPEAVRRLRRHVAHRGTEAELTGTLESRGFHVVESQARTVSFRFRDGAALLGHHFLRLGFVPAWREVAGERAAERLEALRAALDRRAGEAGGIRLTVPLWMVLAR